MLTILLGISLLLIISACGDKETAEENQEVQPVEITDEELIDKEEVIATVNDVEILGRDYNPAYRERKELENFNTDPNEEIDTDKVKEITIDGLVGQELINQETKELGINVSEEEIDKELDILKEQQGDMIDSLLEQFDWTEEDLKNQIRNDLTNNRYINEKIKVDVTDEEVKAEYDRVKEESEKVPEFDEVKENIEVQMIKQKQNEELFKHIEKIKEKSEVDVKI